MCLYPTLIKNPKYKATKKNGGNIPQLKDGRVIFVPIGCGRCMECMKKRAGEWKVRLKEDIKRHKNGKFITLTFSNESYKKLAQDIKGHTGYALDNQIATLATRRFLERWRKKYKKSVRHWFVTEIGGKGTENIHIHGIIWTNEQPKTIKELWNYGFIDPKTETWKGNFVSEKTINYMSKYMTKVDFQHKTYKPVILTSSGIGKGYENSYNATTRKYIGEKTEDVYIGTEGVKGSLPIYYRNKMYSEEERELLWIHKLDQQVRYVLKNKIDISNGMEEYIKARNYARKMNAELGYGSNMKDWKQEQYEKAIRIIMQETRIKNAKT